MFKSREHNRGYYLLHGVLNIYTFQRKWLVKEIRSNLLVSIKIEKFEIVFINNIHRSGEESSVYKEYILSKGKFGQCI